MVGSDVPLVSRLTPMTVAAIGIPDFSGTGNLWNWLAADPPQPADRHDARGAHDAALVRAGRRDGAVRRRAVSRRSRPRRRRRALRPACVRGPPQRAMGRHAPRPARPTSSIGEGGGEIGIGVHHGWVAVGEAPLAEQQRPHRRLAHLVHPARRASRGVVRRTPRARPRRRRYQPGVRQADRQRGSRSADQRPGRMGAAQRAASSRRCSAAAAAASTWWISPIVRFARATPSARRTCSGARRSRSSSVSSSAASRPKFDTGATGRVRHLNLGIGFEL